MTLKEQIRPHSKYWDCYNDEPLEYDHTNKLVKIADNYAIEFNKWYRQNYIKHTILGNVKSDEELLKIYKKEKGL